MNLGRTEPSRLWRAQRFVVTSCFALCDQHETSGTTRKSALREKVDNQQFWTLWKQKEHSIISTFAF